MDTAKNVTDQTKTDLHRYLSPISVWALAFGCAVGWGAFVMPGTTFLPIAGPLGTTLGMLIGAIIMIIIGFNYQYLMKRFPDAGGTYSYSKRVFGYDHGFLSAWFLVLVYIAITWANATALPLIFRKLLGNVFQFGFHYQIAGYEFFFGEALLSLSAIAIFGSICMFGGRISAIVQTVAAFILIGGVLIGFGAAVSHVGLIKIFTISPPFVYDIQQASAIFGIAVLAPWAFVGFESVSHSTEEFKFSTKKTLWIIIAAVITSTMAYVFLTLMAISVLPPGYYNWFDYIGDIGHLAGLKGLPTFYAVNTMLGSTGLVMLALTVIAGVVTGLVGHYIAASRLLYSMARDNLLPEWFSRLNKNKIPSNAILFIMLLSIPIPFFGRTAISWIIDVNTIGATIAYAYTSAAAFKLARDTGDKRVQITGVIGCLISLIFFGYFMVPNFWMVNAMSTESYLILIVWSILGFVFFRYIFNRDTQRRFGKSTIVWITLLFLIFFTSMIWLREVTQDTVKIVLSNLNNYYVMELKDHNVSPADINASDSAYYLQKQMDFVTDSLTNHNILQMILVSITLLIMLNIYNLMMSRERDMEMKKLQAEQSSRAKSTFLSNMSHDIRTPMNAIIGYTTLLKKEKGLPPTAKDYLDKIEASNKHLLALINDVLDLSRIESGKMELDPVKSNIVKAMDDVRDLFSTQMVTKSINYTVTAENITNKMVMCDTPRLNRVLLNLISNAFKFTPEGGRVTVTLKQTGATESVGSYELRVKDTGMGMSPEFAANVFEAYERERTVSNIQGTGLGMAITKSIIDLMGGNIRVETEKGKGTEFIVNIDFPILEDEPQPLNDDGTMTVDGGAHSIDYSNIKVLLVEDNVVNREIATLILSEYGFKLDTAENGKVAVEKVAASTPGDYQLILMDVQMPVMNGYDAAKAIRALDNKELASIPIIAMTANAFAEDVQAARDAGMNSHIAKPIDISKMLETLAEVLK